MKKMKTENILRLLAYFLAFSPFFLMPLENPDIFWHLSSGKYLVENRQFLTRDVFSWTMNGAPWHNFEWLAQAAYFLLYSLGGFAAISIFKGLLFSLIALIFKKTLETDGVEKPFLYLPLLTVSIIFIIDARPDNFTLLGFVFLLYQICLLTGPGAGLFSRTGPVNLILAALLFSLWANLHAGFIYGILLMLLYSLSILACGRISPTGATGAGVDLAIKGARCGHCGGPRSGTDRASADGRKEDGARKKSLNLLVFSMIGAAAATANPLGWRIYSIIFTHMAGSGGYQAEIEEWQSLNPMNARQFPVFFLVAVVLFIAAIGYLRRISASGATGAGAIGDGRISASGAAGAGVDLAIKGARCGHCGGPHSGTDRASADGRKKINWLHLAPALIFFAAAARHARLAPFFGVTGLLYALNNFTLVFGCGSAPQAPQVPEPLATAGSAPQAPQVPEPLATAGSAPQAPQVPEAVLTAGTGKLKNVFLLAFFALPALYYSCFLVQDFRKKDFYRFRTEGLPAFLNANEKTLSGLKLYNPYHCGGWLAFETGLKYPVFMDGRYLFSEKLAEFSAAIRTREAWDAFFGKYGIELVVIENLDQTFEQKLPGGLSLERPFYLNLFPVKEWALIYWDRKYLVFAGRKKLPAEKTEKLEFAHFRANDFEAAEYGVRSGSLAPEKIEKEMEKYFLANPEAAGREKEIFRNWLEKLKRESGTASQAPG